jgi:hypothetical protein
MSMKKYTYILITFILISFLFSFTKKTEPLLTYSESSTGLQTIGLDGGKTTIQMTDINQDGNIDFISVGDHGNPNVNTQEHGIMIWFGNGTGSNWTLVQNGNFGYGGIVVGDVNNDGKLDVGFGIHHNYSGGGLGSKLINVGLGDGTGNNWTAWDTGLATNGESYGMFTSDFGDINNDGLLDIGVLSFGCCNGFHIYKNLGNGHWTQTFAVTNGNNVYMDFVFGDINNDGNLDIATSHQYGTVYFGDGTGNFTLKQNNIPMPGNSGQRSATLGDIDNDGADELAFVTTTGGINVWKWNNTNQNWDNLSGSLPQSGSYEGIRLCDMNMDGYLDVVVFGNGTITIWTGNGGSSWTQSATFSTPTPGSYSAMSVGDADHNGYPDIVEESGEGSNQINKIRFFKETTLYSNLTISPLYPRGFEKIKNNSVRFIDWISAAPQTPVSKVKLEFSSTGNGGPWSLIADSLPNNGRYQWHAPPSVNSINCFIRYTVFIPGTQTTAMTPNPFVVGNLVGINSINGQVPGEFKLYQNYPNPFNPVTKIKFDIPSNVKRETSNLRLVIYDILGNEVGTLVNQPMQPGNYEVQWNGSNNASGIYFYKLGAGELEETKTMVLLK